MLAKKVAVTEGDNAAPEGKAVPVPLENPVGEVKPSKEKSIGPHGPEAAGNVLAKTASEESSDRKEVANDEHHITNTDDNSTKTSVVIFYGTPNGIWISPLTPKDK